MNNLPKLNVAELDWPRIFPFYIDSKFLGDGNKKWWACPLCDGEETFKLYSREKDPKGGWYCARCTKGGDGVALIHEVSGKSYREIFYELRTGNYNGGIPPEVARNVKPVVAKPEKSDAQKCLEMQAAWDEAGPVTLGSPVWVYLSSRIPGLQIEWLGRDVRFHPGMEYVDVWGKRQGKFPVMLLRARSSSGKPCRLHRTYLTAEGTKVPFLTRKGKSRAKLEMSAPDGSGGASILLNAVRSRTLALVEGAETGFAVVARYRNKVEVRCMRNCGSLEQADIEWSDYDHIIIYADRDKVDPKRGYRPGEHSADILATHLRELGKRVSIPKAVVEGMDFRDVWELQYRKRQERLAAFEERRKLRNEVRERNRTQLRTAEHRSAA